MKIIGTDTKALLETKLVGTSTFRDSVSEFRWWEDLRKRRSLALMPWQEVFQKLLSTTLGNRLLDWMVFGPESEGSSSTHSDCSLTSKGFAQEMFSVDFTQRCRCTFPQGNWEQCKAFEGHNRQLWKHPHPSQQASFSSSISPALQSLDASVPKFSAAHLYDQQYFCLQQGVCFPLPERQETQSPKLVSCKTSQQIFLPFKYFQFVSHKPYPIQNQTIWPILPRTDPQPLPKVCKQRYATRFHATRNTKN